MSGMDTDGGRMDGVRRVLREAYNPPPPTPREEMWEAIQARLAPRGGTGDPKVGVVNLAGARRSLGAKGPVGRARLAWGWGAAAAALLVLGVGIGRLTAPGAGPMAFDEAGAGDSGGADAGLLRVAAVEHLGRSEMLLRMVRADGAAGRMDPAVGAWAEGLLSQTRLLLDLAAEEDPAMRDLLEDLELVLVQIVGVSGAGEDDPGRARSELSLALEGLEQRDVLARIQAVVPPGSGLAGT